MKVAEIGRFSARCLTCETTLNLSPKRRLNGYNVIELCSLVYYVIPNEISAQLVHWLQF